MYAEVLKSHNGKAEISILCTDDAEKGLHCGACNAGNRLKGRETVLADNAIGAAAGDFVAVAIKEHGELKAALMLFIIPLLSFLSALAVANAYTLSLWLSFLCGLAALSVALAALHLILKKKTYYFIAGIK